MKRKLITISLTLLTLHSATACPVCERRQPGIFRGIVHGAGPDSYWDYIIVIVMTLITLLVLFFSIKWLLRPGEKNRDHIKRSIFKYEPHE